MNKTRTSIGVKNNVGIRRKANVITGDHGPYVSGDILDANATQALINNVIGDASDALDTLKELGDAITNVASSHEFPSSWTIDGTMADLIADINADSTATKGKSYLSTVSISDLPTGLIQAELKAEILDDEEGIGKVIVFTITSENVKPYHWEATSAYGRPAIWRTFEAGLDEDDELVIAAALNDLNSKIDSINTIMQNVMASGWSIKYKYDDDNDWIDGRAYNERFYYGSYETLLYTSELTFHLQITGNYLTTNNVCIKEGNYNSLLPVQFTINDHQQIDKTFDISGENRAIEVYINGMLVTRVEQSGGGD